jgi:hypothetical protein
MQPGNTTDHELKDGRVLGGGEFVGQVLQHTERGCTHKGETLDRIIETVLGVLGIADDELMSRNRATQVADARSIICYASYCAGHRGVDIARRLNISGPGVTVAVRRGKALIGNFPELCRIVSGGNE